MTLEKKTKQNAQGVQKESTLRPVFDIEETGIDADGKSLDRKKT